MRIDAISIFPEYLAPLELSLIGKARQEGLLDLRVHDLRTFTTDRHRTVDDTPYGGGAGMVMKPEPWAQALESVLDAVGPSNGHPPADNAAADGSSPVQSNRPPTLIVPSPAGEVFDQRMAHELASREHLVFACGRYEGIDDRLLDWASGQFDLRPVSLGDYVLNGGEVAVLAIVEAVGRLLPGVVGNPDSLVEESHADGLLEYPVYTKPSNWRGRDVPEALLSGNHAGIARYRREQQLIRTAARRPDLIARLDPDALTGVDVDALLQLGFEVQSGRVVRASGD
ncbi:tRNA (guanosine(37)-N1)-methyltransferase TrmD [Arthrobacter castelli]|uniref:tRNA (guanosine(37)-N1)-methyltransferase TrmD n=1 Tax=Arthrobacter castelli TaxID=271431 RepID=UPI00041AB742|nr:tRNA (guanosine(37)-N1)-methyltransferase TrmD [Arthrobacter castelli]